MSLSTARRNRVSSRPVSGRAPDREPQLPDIRREDFDDGNPLVFRLNTDFASQIGAVQAKAEGIEIDVENGEISIAPRVIKKGVLLAAQFVTDGRPRIDWVGQLADVQIREG